MKGDDVEVWEFDSEDEFEPSSGKTTDLNTQLQSDSASKMQKLVGFICMFLLSWQAVFRIPDGALNVMFKFLSLLFLKLGDITGSVDMKTLSQHFPSSLMLARKVQSGDSANFSKLIVCQKCSTTYRYEDCLERNGIKKCTYVRFPRHPQKRMRVPCNSPLLKLIKTASGRHISTPLKVFCYQSIIQTIRCLVQQPGMLDVLNKWKDRTIPSGVMADVYDGSVWKSFLTVDGKPFLSRCYTFGLLINVDWFQPYTQVQYSVGAIYLAILNFPRQLRYRRENMVLIGVIPGPHEPNLHINSFLESLVDELLKLWKGIEMPTTEGKQVIHAALLCSSSDVPATRKVGGFVGHGAHKGCSRCLKSFSTTALADKPDYSGFNCCTWPKRRADEHRIKGMEWKYAKTQVERQRIEKEYGVRFSELLRLPYFDSARFSVVDPMHNILLGTTKLMLTIWKEKSLLTTADFEKIQSQVDHFVVPPDVGRIPHKISSGFTSFTADHLKNWALIYSLVVLKPILPEVHYQCWCMFVQASRLLCSRAISQANALRLHDILICFCKKFEELYGASACTPNLHLHCHLKECILDFGPSSAFWLFACERLNGVLGAMSTNHHTIETQLMKKFSSSQQALQSVRNSDSNEIEMLLSSFHFSKGSI